MDLKSLKTKLNKKNIIILSAALAVVIAVVCICIGVFSKKEEPPKYEPAPPEAPRLASLGVIGESIDFSKEVRYYEIAIPAGKPTVPTVWATASSDIILEVNQAFFSEGSNEASAYVFLDDGIYQNSYEVRFVKKENKGIVLQYDDRYLFKPDHKLKKGESYSFAVSSPDGNVSVDKNGNVIAIGISEKESIVNAYVGTKLVDTIKIKKTVKAVLDVFIISGQGNAGGEGGDAENCTFLEAGKAYTAELYDEEYKMTDLSAGRKGFTPALADKWCEQTGNKALFIQTAVSNVSVTQWGTNGAAYENAVELVSYHIAALKKDDSFYTVNKVFCFWLHGEWDIAFGMSAQEYLGYLKEFYKGMKAESSFEMLAIIPQRFSRNVDGTLMDFDGVYIAQAMMANTYDDVRIITRFPESAFVESGFVSNGNVYYSQNGYNMLGEDCAYNLFGCYDPTLDRTESEIDIYLGSYNDKLEEGRVIDIAGNDEKSIVVFVSPLYAKTKTVDISYNKDRIAVTDWGILKKGGLGGFSGAAELSFACGKAKKTFTVNCIGSLDEQEKEKVEYVWDFNDLTEEKGRNDLSVSDRTTGESYKFQDGMITLSDRNADLVLKKTIRVSSEQDWSIEWSGYITDNSILLGGSYSTKGYIFLAPYSQNWGYSVRMVDDTGKAYYLLYGDSAQSNRIINKWKIAYSKDTKILSLYLNGKRVSSSEQVDSFTFSFSNLFGRYGSEIVNYCYIGKMNKLSVTVE